MHFLLIFKIILASKSCLPHCTYEKTEALERSHLVLEFASDKARIYLVPRVREKARLGNVGAYVFRVVTGLLWLGHARGVGVGSLKGPKLAAHSAPFRGLLGLGPGAGGVLTGALLHGSFGFRSSWQQKSRVNILQSDWIILHS